MSGRAPFDSAAEDRIAMEMSQQLEAMTMATAVEPSPEFGDRVMLAIGNEPVPLPARAFRVALVGGHLRTAAAAVVDAGRSLGRRGMPLAAQAQALALVLVLAGSLAIVGGAGVGALGLLDPANPGPTAPAPSDALPSPLPSPSALPSVEPSPSPEASETAEPTETTEPTDETEDPEPTSTESDDHGGDSGNSGSGSGSGGRSGSGSGRGG